MSALSLSRSAPWADRLTSWSASAGAPGGSRATSPARRARPACASSSGVVALGVVLARVRAAALLAVLAPRRSSPAPAEQVVELQRLDQVGVPDQRAVGDPHVGELAADLARSPWHALASTSPVRNTAAWSCMVRCISSRGSRRSAPAALGVAQRSSRATRLAGIGGSGAWRAPGLTSRRSACAAARPNTTRSSSEFEPSRLAPCTDTQAASPTAIRPGTTCSGSPSFSVTTSPW
jgi:hypothetical protein